MVFLIFLFIKDHMQLGDDQVVLVALHVLIQFNGHQIPL
jgi:hypothetical protein